MILPERREQGKLKRNQQPPLIRIRNVNSLNVTNAMPLAKKRATPAAVERIFTTQSWEETCREILRALPGDSRQLQR
jgi:hypothetical protein